MSQLDQGGIFRVEYRDGDHFAPRLKVAALVGSLVPETDIGKRREHAFSKLSMATSEAVADSWVTNPLNSNHFDLVSGVCLGQDVAVCKFIFRPVSVRSHRFSTRCLYF